MCGLLFEYDVRLSAKMYFTKSYMNIRTIKRDVFHLASLFLLFKIEKARTCGGIIQIWRLQRATNLGKTVRGLFRRIPVS